MRISTGTAVWPEISLPAKQGRLAQCSYLQYYLLDWLSSVELETFKKEILAHVSNHQRAGIERLEMLYIFF